jgi:hypothetical protein
MTTYISVDVESASLIPNPHSLLSVGAIEIESGTTFHEVLAGTFTLAVNWEPETFRWWMEEEQAAPRERLNRLASRETPYTARSLEVARKFYYWCKLFEDDLRFVAWPASFDYPYIQMLFMNAGFANPFNYRTVDIRSYACGVLGLPLDAPREMFPDWYHHDKGKYPHDALEDAKAQAVVFQKLRDYQAAKS